MKECWHALRNRTRLIPRWDSKRERSVGPLGKMGIHSLVHFEPEPKLVQFGVNCSETGFSFTGFDTEYMVLVRMLI